MAYIRRLPSGRWQATVRVGKRRVYGPNPPALLKDQARDWAREQETHIAHGDWRDPKLARITFDEWFARWWDARVVEPETLPGQASVRDRHVLPQWKDWRIGSIGRLEVQAWVARMQRDGVGAATVLKAYSIFRGAMNAAVDEELLGRSPCRKIALPAAAKAPPRFFEVDQVETIAAALPEPHATVALVMAWCGLRWEEAAGLEVRHVNRLRRELVVEQVVTRARRIKPYAKTEAGNRVVPAPDHVLQRLDGWWVAAKDGRDDAVFTQEAAGRKPTEHRLLFMTERAGTRLPLNYPAWWEAWQSMHRRLARAGAGVPEHRPHTLRHTAASWWVQNGVDIYEVQRLLGHADLDSTIVYSHLQPGVHRNVREAWAALERSRLSGPASDARS